MANSLTNNIPIGDIQFYDDYVPALSTGTWFIKTSQTLTHNNQQVNTEDLTAAQEFIVSAPQFSLAPSEIISQYPPAGSTGRYGTVLPNIVLKEPSLPWERQMKTSGDRQPWLALLVFNESELNGGDALTHAINSTVGDFLKLASPVLKPALRKEDDVADSDPCNYILLLTSVFQSIAPRLKELRYLTHCRQINTGDKAMLGVNETGLFSVVVANRFPAVVATNAPPVKQIVHLVSLEGLEDYLTETPSFGAFQQVALLSLARWTFQVLPENQADFVGLAQDLLVPPGWVKDPLTQEIPPENFLLRLPQPFNANRYDGPKYEAMERLLNGFVPLAYQTRTGETTLAWYRGPLVPVKMPLLEKKTPFFTSDAAMIYQPEFGVFDLSLAAAWEIGRAAALADKAFGQELLDFRRRAHRLTDRLLNRLQSDAFSAAQIAELKTDTSVQDEFLNILNQQLLTDVANSGTQPPEPSMPVGAGAETDPKMAVQNFLADPQVQQTIRTLIEDDLKLIAQWLGKLLLLYPVPFPYLVSDERMLPVESLRCFYLDANWLGALLDGALSLGMETSRETFFYEITHDLIHRAAYDAAQTYRTQLQSGEDIPAQPLCGLLIRSALVSSWPNLAVRPYHRDGSLIKVLRMDHLSPNVLLCIFSGVPLYTIISEPQESLAFGVNDDGQIALRNPLAPIGAQLPGDPMLPIRDMSGAKPLLLRTAASLVLNLEPDSPTGLVQSLKTALGSSVTSFGPADFALQMVKAPESFRLNGE